MTVIEQIQELKKESLGLLTVLTGEDVGQYQLAKEVLLKQIGFDPSDLAYAYFDMSEADYATVDLDLVSLPFFADEKIVILDYFSDLTTAKKRYLTDEELKRFEAYLENPADTTRLVVLAPGKLDSKRRLVKLLKRDACIFQASPLKEVEVRQFFQKELQAKGLQMEPEVFQEFLLKSNFDFSELTKNMALLLAFKGPGQIQIKDIQEVIPKTLQDNIFDLSQLILQARVDEARSLVKDLVLQGEDEIKLLSILLSQFRIYLQVQLLKAEGKAEPAIHTELSDLTGKKLNPYQVKYALRDSRHLSVGFLEKVIRLLIETDYQIKTGRFDKDYLFDVTVLKLATM